MLNDYKKINMYYIWKNIVGKVNMIRYSVIIPVYNAEEYLDRLFNKIKLVKRKDIEYCFINDGSIDNSLSKLNKLELNNKIIINQQNKGVSYSRNVGIENASGEYILFVDCDDWFDEKMFEYFDKIISNNNYDVLKFSYYVSDDSAIIEKRKIVDKDTVFNKIEMLNNILLSNKYNSVWNQLIKRKFILDNNIRFKENRKNAEDFEFNLELYSKCQKVFVSSKCLYYYYYNINGTTNSLEKNNTIKCFRDSLYIHSNAIKYIVKDLDCDAIYLRLFREVVLSYLKLFRIRKISHKELLLLTREMYSNHNYIKICQLIKQKKFKITFFEKIIVYKKIYVFIPILYLYFRVKMRCAK